MSSAKSGRPAFTPVELSERTIHRRAVEAVIWGMAAVNYDLMLHAAIRGANGRFNQIVYWSHLPDWKIQTLTPNPDAIYLTPFVNTKDVGPVVIDIPPADAGSITGTIMDLWQSPLEDVGPAGADKGQGARYVILGPGERSEDVPPGFIALPSLTYQGYALLRSIPKSGSERDIAAAVAYGKRIRLYPFAQRDNPPATTFVDVADIVYDSTIPYDARFFESLDRIVQAEPWLERDKAMIASLESIGIEKGKTFDPDARTRAICAAVTWSGAVPKALDSRTLSGAATKDRCTLWRRVASSRSCGASALRSSGICCEVAQAPTQRSSARAGPGDETSAETASKAIIAPATKRKSVLPFSGTLTLPAAQRKGHVAEKRNRVVERNSAPGSRRVEGNCGWLGLSGKCWVSSASPSRRCIGSPRLLERPGLILLPE